jgi:hypothetical protein
MMMLRFGLLLLLTSSVGVTLRELEMAYVMGPMVKIVCSAALAASVACFLATYFSFDPVHHKARVHK